MKNNYNVVPVQVSSSAIIASTSFAFDAFKSIEIMDKRMLAMLRKEDVKPVWGEKGEIIKLVPSDGFDNEQVSDKIVEDIVLFEHLLTTAKTIYPEYRSSAICYAEHLNPFSTEDYE